MARKRQRTISYVDYDGQQGVIELQMPLLEIPVAENIQWATFKSALDAILLGEPSRETNTYYEQLLSSGTKSATPEAQRQVKWLVSYEDTTEWLDSPTNTIANPNFRRVFNTELPTADLTLRIGGSEIVYTNNDPAGAPPVMQTFVTAFEAIVRSPSGGTVNVLQIKSHSRNV